MNYLVSYWSPIKRVVDVFEDASSSSSSDDERTGYDAQNIGTPKKPAITDEDGHAISPSVPIGFLFANSKKAKIDTALLGQYVIKFDGDKDQLRKWKDEAELSHIYGEGSAELQPIKQSMELTEAEVSLYQF